MRLIILFSVGLLICIPESYSMPVDVANDVGPVKYFDAQLMQKITTTKITKSRLTDIILEIAGIDIPKLEDQLKVTIEKLPDIFTTFQERLKKIQAQSSEEFQNEIARITLKALGRFGHAYNKVDGSVSQSEIEIIKSASTLLNKLYELKDSETVTKEEVVKLFEDFLGTKYEGTIQDYFYDFKLNLEFYFILDEINVSLREAVKKEGPEMIASVKTFIADLMAEGNSIVRPFLDIIKPAILADV